MKIAVISANGKAGRLITQEAVNRGQDVTAIVRSKNESVATKVIQKDLFNLTAEDLKSFDVVIDAFGAWTLETIPEIPKAVKYLCEVLKGSNARLLIVGGAGSLYTNKEHTATLDSGADFPDAFKPLAKAHGEALNFLRGIKDVKWTYISPAADFQADGKRTGKYTLAGEELTLSSKGKSVISYADYAIAMVDEAMSGKNICKRISVVEE